MDERGDTEEDRGDPGSKRPVAVGLAPGDPRGQRIAQIADDLGVSVVDGAPTRERTSIGDVLLPRETDDWYLEAAILRALEPRHVLFLCVANSARSQLAEGIARSMGRGADPALKISSAGSEPTSVRPQAVAVLEEIGVDISGQRSTGIDEVERPVDAVITLCAEEVCPVWLEDAWRLHWGLPDPAAVEGGEEEKLEAFRAVRDELRKRLGVLFCGRPV